LKGARAIARKTNGERTTEHATCKKVRGEKVAIEEGEGQWDRKGEKYM